MFSPSIRHWVLAIVLIATLLLSAQVLHQTRSPDGSLALALPKWHDWPSHPWQGGEEPGPTPSESSKSEVPPKSEPAASEPVTSEPVASSPSDSKPPPSKAPSTTTVKSHGSPTLADEMLQKQPPPPPGFDPASQMFDLKKADRNPAGPRPDQIVILTGTDGRGHNMQIQNVVEMALHNRQEYAQRHGYIHHFINTSRLEIPSNPSPVWKKLPAIVETFQTYPDAEWIWWLDLDAIIMTPDFKLEHQILSDNALEKLLLRNEELKKSTEEGFGVFTAQDPQMRDIHLIIAQDQSTINAGSFMLRRSEVTQSLLSMWRDPLLMSHGFQGEEQDALIYILTANEVFRNHVGIVDARVLNAFWSGWKEGDLMIHFAGCWVPQHCQKNWDAVWKQRYGTLKFPPPSDKSGDGAVAADARG